LEKILKAPRDFKLSSIKKGPNPKCVKWGNFKWTQRGPLCQKGLKRNALGKKLWEEVSNVKWNGKPL